MKIAKYIFLLLLLLSITISVFVATKNGDYTIERTKLIDVPKEAVFKYVSDTKNWESINPWKGEATKINSIQNIDNETILQNISINNIESEMQLHFKDTLSKKTWVTWTKKGTLGFKDKLLGMINKGTQNNFAQMFDKGLANLNAILTEEINTFNVKINGIVARDTVFYIQRPLVSTPEELPKKIKYYLPKLNDLLSSTNTATNGKPFIIYHSKDSINNKITYSIAVPTKRKIYTSSESDIFNGQTNPYQAVKATLTGNYIHKKEAIAKLSQFMEDNKLESDILNKEVEIIPINSANENSAAKWTTEIYIPVKKKIVVIKVKPVKKDSLNTIIPSNFKTPTK